jgi:Flp pilus assembly pilin Flp
MDFGQAALLVGATYGLTKWVTALFPKIPSQLKPPLAMIIAIGSVFLVGETVWSNDQVIQGHSLEGLDSWSKLFVGILLGLGAVVLDTGFKTLRNIGQNDTVEVKT